MTIIKRMPSLLSIFRCLLAVVAIARCAQAASAANWVVNRANHITLAPPAGVTVAEMSGVTYLGPVAGAHRFLAAEETKGELIQFDLTFTAAGAIDAVSNIAAVDIIPTNDIEGIAYAGFDRNSAFVAAENGATLREISLINGSVVQTVTLPAVFSNVRPNLSFESLTRSPDQTAMWIANEQALTVDGSTATPAEGTTVRLVQMHANGKVVALGPQYAYQVEPIHGTSTLGSPQSGLSDLAVMPDGTLLALERSVAVTTPIYLNRIYEVNAAGATDVSVAPFDAGLTGQTYSPVGKTLLWSGAVDGAGGQNMEGLALGPRINANTWVLIGVVDNQNGGDPLSANTIVAFTATLLHSADFNGDGSVDGGDFLQWQRSQGKTTGATFPEGDANLDGAVDGADLGIWKALFGGTTTAGAEQVPEPAATAVGATVSLVFAAHKKARRSSRRA